VDKPIELAALISRVQMNRVWEVYKSTTTRRDRH